MTEPTNTRPLTDVTVKNLKSGTVLADVGDHRGLRVRQSGGKGLTSFYYRYRSPAANGRIRQFMIGHYIQSVGHGHIPITTVLAPWQM